MFPKTGIFKGKYDMIDNIKRLVFLEIAKEHIKDYDLENILEKGKIDLGLDGMTDWLGRERCQQARVASVQLAGHVSKTYPTVDPKY